MAKKEWGKKHNNLEGKKEESQEIRGGACIVGVLIFDFETGKKISRSGSEKRGRRLKNLPQKTGASKKGAKRLINMEKNSEPGRLKHRGKPSTGSRIGSSSLGAATHPGSAEGALNTE